MTLICQVSSSLLFKCIWIFQIRTFLQKHILQFQIFTFTHEKGDVLDKLNELCMSSKHSDVSFIVENTMIPAHKTILSARSPYFEKLFTANFTEAKQSEIKLQVPLDAFKLILRFIYTGHLSLTALNVDQIIDICELADMYDLEALKETISEYLKAKLSLENCVDILKAASLHAMDGLNQACLAFIDGRSAELIKHDTFKTLSSTLLCTLLKRDTFYAPEIDIFVAVKDWISKNPAADSKVIDK